MKYIKMIGLLAVAAAALMAFAGSASATEITSSTGSTPRIHAVNENGHVVLHNPVGTISCNSTVEGTVNQHGPGVTAKGPISTLHFTECTEGEVHVTSPGSLEVHPTAITGDGTLTSSGANITVTMFGVTCGYTTNNTHIGTLTGGEHATLDINSASIPRTHGSFFCGATGTWTGNYKVTHPTDLTVHAS